MQTAAPKFAVKDIRTKDIRVYCFVCTGNTCRSPMAAALLTAAGAGRGYLAFSRGIAAKDGSPISENAARALEEVGIESRGRNDYRSHRSVRFTAADFDRCDGVFCLSAAHAEALFGAYPEHASQIRVLGEIPNPHGGDLACYRACLADIRRAMADAFPMLFAEGGA